MAKFCKKCGSVINEATGKCPKCDSTATTNNLQQPPSPPTSNIPHQRRPAPGNIPPQRRPAPGNVPPQRRPAPGNVPPQKRQLSKKELKEEKKKQKKQAKKAQKKQKRAQLSFKQKTKRFFVKFFAIILSLVILTSSCACALVYFDLVDIGFISDIMDKLGIAKANSSEESFEVTPPDADEYFSENSTVVSKTNAKDSYNVLTEAEVFKSLTNRGFSQYPITTEYSMDGEYSTATAISDTSSTKHPMYQTYYITPDGDVWTIFSINGEIFANPTSYNTQSTLGVRVLVSESDTITSYDSTTNRFYESVPKDTALFVMIADDIDSETLDKLTTEEIDNYVY